MIRQKFIFFLKYLFKKKKENPRFYLNPTPSLKKMVEAGYNNFLIIDEGVYTKYIQVDNKIDLINKT